MRKHGKVDANQKAIVQALRKVGASVTSLAEVGGGTPDLLVGFRRRTFVLECKVKGAKRTQAQIAWWFNFNGEGDIVYSETDALRAIGAI